MMSFPDAVKKCFRDYLTFSGRSPRSEYWWFALFISAVMAVIGLVQWWADSANETTTALVFQAIFLLFWLVTLLPSLSVGVRRLHDIDRTGWWMLLGVPLIASDIMTFYAGQDAAFVFQIVGLICLLALLVFFVLKGSDGDNRFGSNPLRGGGGG